MRESVFNRYINHYGVDKNEILNDLKDFKNIQEFFTRKVKPRNIVYNKEDILSPADSTVVSVSEVTENQTFYLKDFKYSIHEIFTGVQNEQQPNFDQFKKNKNNKLICVTSYLHGRDYHRFHFPFDCKVQQSIHFPGQLQTLRYLDLQQGCKAYEKNERVVIEGEYHYGNFKLAPIGANYVASIKLSFDERIQTNRFLNRNVQKYQYNNLNFKAGDELGLFLIGSSFIMLLEVPQDMKLNIEYDQHIKYGQKIN